MPEPVATREKAMKRLDNHVFFFDSDVEKHRETFGFPIGILGGKITEFFGKHVTHVISDRIETVSNEENTMSNSGQPMFSLTRQQRMTRMLGGQQGLSVAATNTTPPLLTSGMKAITPITPMTSTPVNSLLHPRLDMSASQYSAQTMAPSPSPLLNQFNFDASITSPISNTKMNYHQLSKESHIVKQARLWGKKMYTLARLREIIDKYLPIAAQDSKDVKIWGKENLKLIGGRKSTKFYTFRYPFIMIGDDQDLYRPVFKEFPRDKHNRPTWPELKLNRDYLNPFYCIKAGDRSQKSTEKKDSTTFQERFHHREKYRDISPEFLRKFNKLGPSNGFCECCLVKYSDLIKVSYRKFLQIVD